MDYHNTTSKLIITRNHIINPSVARSVWPFRWLSGITSSTTTNIIAPAAKAKAYGRSGVNIVTNTAPITAATGSTRADHCP